MERLTKRSDDGKGYIPCHWKESAEAVDKGQNRLADIEDILGDDYDLPRLRELVKADREGRCFMLPCKRHDTLWTFCNYPKSKVYSFKVTDISTLNGRMMLNTDILSVIDARDIGKTVFLTREAAEVALKEREKNERR